MEENEPDCLDEFNNGDVSISESIAGSYKPTKDHADLMSRKGALNLRRRITIQPKPGAPR